MRFEPLLCLPTAWTSVCARFGVHLFEGTVTLADMDRLQSVGDRWNAQHPEKRVELVVVLPSNARMTHEERMRMVRLIKHGEAHRAATGTVILAEGLLASVQRSVLTGMMMLAPAPHPAKVFGNLTEAVAWLAPYVKSVCGDALKPEQLASMLDAHLAEFRARPDRPGSV